MEDLFYRDQQQVAAIVDKFSREILSKKEPDAAFFSKYRIFKYNEELDRIQFTYKPQDTDSFIREFGDFFENLPNFDNPGVMYNVLPNPNIYGQVASFFASLANPNFCMDLPAGKLMVIEKAVIKYMNELASWNPQTAGGIFTFGGKGTLVYALKVALDKLYPDIRQHGIRGKNFVISNDLGHPSHIQICNWLGVGEDNCVRLPTYDAVVNVNDFKKAFVTIIEKGGKLPLIILNGMTTNNHTFDDVKAIHDARDEIVAQYELDYTPHIHVDSVLGWVYLLLTRYDFERNPLGLTAEVTEIMERKAKQAAAITYADSFAADFHKTGFCSYVSSAFLVKDKTNLFDIEGHYSESDGMIFSEYAPFDYALESSRSPHGPVSSFATLKTLGVEGFTKILANHTEAYLYLKNEFHKQPNALVCNYSEASNLLFLAFKPDEYIDLEITTDTPEEVAGVIKEFNSGFYSFLLDKSKEGKNDIYFSCSRSYIYLGKSYGCLKIYAYNSHLDLITAKKIYLRINELFNEYVRQGKTTGKYKFFDYAELKGKTHA